MRVLLTGFGPFPGVPANPSEMIAAELGARPRPHDGIELVTSALPVEYEAAGARIHELVSSVEPDAVLCLGVAAGRAAINLERFALNFDDAPIPDNDGRLLQGTAIVPDGPAAYQSTLPLDRMHAALVALDVPSTMSNHAGTYICNHTFYAARHHIETLGHHAPCGLIHIPLPLELVGNQAPVRALSLVTIAASIEACLQVLAEERSGIEVGLAQL
jgi:pyroglutamyl-peptidase